MSRQVDTEEALAVMEAVLEAAMVDWAAEA
jgi:hypothetical protein